MGTRMSLALKIKLAVIQLASDQRKGNSLTSLCFIESFLSMNQVVPGFLHELSRQGAYGGDSYTTELTPPAQRSNGRRNSNPLQGRGVC